MAKSKSKTKPARSDADRRVRQCERLARLLRTLQLISGKGKWDANALAAELECSTRTVHRLLQTLSMAGVPWYFDEKTRAYRVRPGYKLPLLNEHSDSSKKAQSPHELETAISELVKAGDEFARSLDSFLETLRKVRVG